MESWGGSSERRPIRPTPAVRRRYRHASRPTSPCGARFDPVTRLVSPKGVVDKVKVDKRCLWLPNDVLVHAVNVNDEPGQARHARRWRALQRVSAAGCARVGQPRPFSKGGRSAVRGTRKRLLLYARVSPPRKALSGERGRPCSQSLNLHARAQDPTPSSVATRVSASYPSVGWAAQNATELSPVASRGSGRGRLT